MRATPDAVPHLLEVLARAGEDARAVAPRSRRAWLRAARHGRLLLAQVNGQDAAWVVQEPCGGGVVEWGGLYVMPAFRQGAVMREITRVALSLAPCSVVVTMDARFATYLVQRHGAAEVSLARAAGVSHGMVLMRRLAPGRWRAALAHLGQAHRDGAPVRYLVRRRPAGEVPAL